MPGAKNKSVIPQKLILIKEQHIMLFCKTKYKQSQLMY